jgi:hypothetical protein
VAVRPDLPPSSSDLQTREDLEDETKEEIDSEPKAGFKSPKVSSLWRGIEE